jgi:hypothetical protein
LHEYSWNKTQQSINKKLVFISYIHT